MGEVGPADARLSFATRATKPKSEESGTLSVRRAAEELRITWKTLSAALFGRTFLGYLVPGNLRPEVLVRSESRWR